LKINVFRRRQPDAQLLQELLENYVARAQAVAEAGGGGIWVVEPSLPLDLLPDFTEAVVRHLAANGVATDGVTFLEGTASTRVVLLADPPSGAPEEPRELDLGDEELTLPLPAESTLGAQ
jgi:hypothetical protein